MPISTTDEMTEAREYAAAACEEMADRVSDSRSSLEWKNEYERLIDLMPSSSAQSVIEWADAMFHELSLI